MVDSVLADRPFVIFTWYVEDELGLRTICERLNSDLDRYPPPKRNRKDVNDLPQAWSKSQLHSLLHNPSTPASTSGGATTNGAVDRSCARATVGSGADVPDLREALWQAEGEELIELLDALRRGGQLRQAGTHFGAKRAARKDFVSSPDAK